MPSQLTLVNRPRRHQGLRSDDRRDGSGPEEPAHEAPVNRQPDPTNGMSVESSGDHERVGNGARVDAPPGLDRSGIEIDIVREGINTVLPATFVGSGLYEVRSGGVLLYGEFRGDLVVGGTLIIARGAVVSGSIRARKVYVDGTIARGADGNRSSVIAHELVITDEGQVGANLVCGTFACGKGSRVDGTIQSGG